MIPLIDVAFLDKLVRTFPNTDVRWMPPDLGRKSAYTNYKEYEEKGRKSITLFRRSLDYAADKNRPQMAAGQNMRRYSEDLTTVWTQKRIVVDAHYDFSVWAYRQTDADAVVRDLLFSFVYSPIQVTLRGITFPFTVEPLAPAYAFEPEDTTQTMRLYNVKAELKVLDAFWVVDQDTRTVMEIIVHIYNILTSGEPVLLETLDLVPIL